MLQALLQWIDDNPIRFGIDSAMGRLTRLILVFFEEDEVTDMDVLLFMRIIKEFFRNITAKDLKQADEWEMSSNMSPNLVALFSGNAKSIPVNSNVDWIAPAKPGLDNSARLIANSQTRHGSKAYLDSKAMVLNSVDSSVGTDLAKVDNAIQDSLTEFEVDGKDVSDNSYDKNEFKSDTADAKNIEAIGEDEEEENDFKHESESRENNNVDADAADDNNVEDDTNGNANNDDANDNANNNEEEDDDEDYDEDDDDEDYDYGDDDDEEGGELNIANMSVNLMRALGMDTTGMEVETDWKPPDVTGIEANPDSYKFTN